MLGWSRTTDLLAAVIRRDSFLLKSILIVKVNCSWHEAENKNRERLLDDSGANDSSLFYCYRPDLFDGCWQNSKWNFCDFAVSLRQGSCVIRRASFEIMRRAHYRCRHLASEQSDFDARKFMSLIITNELDTVLRPRLMYWLSILILISGSLARQDIRSSRDSVQIIIGNVRTINDVQYLR